MFKKLRAKFILTTMVLLTSIMVLIFVFIYISVKTNTQDMIFFQIGETLNNPKFAHQGDINNKVNFEKNDLIAIYDKKNSKLAFKTSLDLDEDEVVELIDKSVVKGEERGFVDYKEYSLAYMCKASPMGLEIVFGDSSAYDETMFKLIVTFLIVGVISLSFLLMVSFIIASKAIKPVEEAFKSQKQFIADASHELKTPLAIINTNIDVLMANRASQIKDSEKWLGYIRFQTDRMSKLISNMLFLAKADNNEQLGVLSSFNISDVIMNQLLTFEATIYEQNLKLNTDIQEDISFNGDKESVIQLVGILVDNAIKNSYDNSNIDVKLHIKKQKIVLSVKNIGETISKEHIEKIFERFYRVDESRERTKGGYGLGLSIAKSIATKHNGRIYCNSDNNNTEFVVEFPIE